MILLVFSIGCHRPPSSADFELPEDEVPPPQPSSPSPQFAPRTDFDTSGFSMVTTGIMTWPAETSLDELSRIWTHPGEREAVSIARFLSQPGLPLRERMGAEMARAMCFNYEGDAEQAYSILTSLRSQVEVDRRLATEWLYSLIYYQGVTALRRGENENCIMCRGDSTCILPISPLAIHQNPAGSRAAIVHLSEYLDEFPDDQQVAWLLNVAHMTLGEHPAQVDPRYLIEIDSWGRSAEDVGQFRDISADVGLDRMNQSGGGIMDDFDNDGLLDVVSTALDPTQPMGLFRNLGNGHFSDVAAFAKLLEQRGGLYCVQADYNNDGFLDIYIPRGAWLLSPIRPSLLRNEGDGTWADVTAEAGLLHPVNSNSVAWGDYDNDGNLDLFVCCELQPNQLFHNRGDGHFEMVPHAGGVMGEFYCKGATWIDFDNDDAPDLFVNNLHGTAQLYHNDRHGRFNDVTLPQGIDGPQEGFACWTWDYDNDGWLDIFATSYNRSIAEVVHGMRGEAKGSSSSKLWRNHKGQRFEDRTEDAGLNSVYETMGCNFGDIDNDGWLDVYLGTGDPQISTLVPNRMFRNAGGQHFVEVTGSSRTGHLQKGHAVGFGDWDRNGDLDLFIQMGGAINGDKYHNILFQNPGHDNHQLTIRLIGRGSNRAALGARLQVQTAGSEPRQIHRQVTSGSSFGANTLEVSIGVGSLDSVERLEIHWPTSGETQVFNDLPVDDLILIVEGATGFHQMPTVPIPLPGQD